MALTAVLGAGDAPPDDAEPAPPIGVSRPCHGVWQDRGDFFEHTGANGGETSSPGAAQTGNATGKRMTLTYSNDQHRAYMAFTDHIGQEWVGVFDGDTAFYNAAYWDLLTRMWRATEPVRKTDALKFMTAIKSAHTAGKYLDVALEKGLIIEQDNPQDARSKLLVLSDEMRGRMDRFFDGVVGRMLETAKQVEGMD